MPNSSDQKTTGSDRRNFLWFSSMMGGLVASYGMFAAMAAKFLFPVRPIAKGWMLVGQLTEYKVGNSFSYQSPTDETIAITRLDEGDSIESFIALSSTCPHLGCHVHWEPQNNRFFCPCHDGAFDAKGIATKGPPAVAKPKQRLAQYPLKIERGLLFIEVRLERLV